MSVDSEVQFGESLSESSSEGCSESSEARASFCSASEDFNHTMIVQSQLIVTEEATQYVRRTNS